MASTKAVHERFGRLDPYELARKELFAEGISSSKIYLDPLRPSLEDLLDMITSACAARSPTPAPRPGRVPRARPASASSPRPATRRARRCRSAGSRPAVLPACARTGCVDSTHNGRPSQLRLVAPQTRAPARTAGDARV